MKTTCVSPFPVTQWTAVVNVCSQGSAEQRNKALDQLCQAYWYPLYSFARRSGRRRQDAEDLTQGFFFYLLERNLFLSANQERGKLRTFLLTAFQRYIRDTLVMEHAEKRGGGREIFSLDVDAAERHFGEPSDTLTPHEIYDRNWALLVLHSTIDQLREAEETARRGGQFLQLEPFLNPRSHSEPNYDVAAISLEMSTEAVRKAVSRLRGKFRDLLRRQIAMTLTEPTEDQVDSELAALKAALRG